VAELKLQARKVCLL